MKVQVKNFQAITEGTFEFNPGITILQGPTNSGKTAVFRALVCLLTNPAEASSFINYNVEELSVKVQIDEDVIEFCRNKDKAWYLVNGHKYSKLARSNIFDIFPSLNQKFVYKAEDPRKILNFQTEDQTAFPFDRSDTEMFKLFERIFNISDTKAAMDTLKKEEDEVAFKMSQYSADRVSFTSDIEKITEILSELDLPKIELLKQQRELCNADAERLRSVLSSLCSYIPFLAVANELPVLSQINGDTQVQELIMLKSKIDSCTKYFDYLEKYTEVVLSPLDLSLESTCLELQHKLAEISRLNLLAEAQEKAQGVLEAEIKEIEKELASYKNCPLCGSSIGDNQ